MVAANRSGSQVRLTRFEARVCPQGNRAASTSIPYATSRTEHLAGSGGRVGPVVDPDNIILAEIAAELDLDQT